MEKLLTLNDVTKIVGFKKSTVYKFMKNKNFPRPIKIRKSSRWLLSDINNWINQFKEETMT